VRNDKTTSSINRRYKVDTNNDPLVVAVNQLSTLRARMDAVHSDGATDAGGDGHGDAGGDGLNIPEQS
jgi:hypothetical protein